MGLREGLLRSLGLLRDNNYRYLFAATAVSQFGFRITQLAIPLVAIISLRASAFEVGVLTAMSTVPFLLFGLPAGAWVDRMRRRSVLIAGDLGRALALATVPVAWSLDVLTIWQLYGVAFLVGVLTVFFDIADQSYLPYLVGRENLVEGNAKLESVRAVAQVSGPAVAGVVIRLLTAPITLLVNAVVLGASAMLVVAIRKQEPKPRRRDDRNFRREIGEGLRFVIGDRLLRPIVLCNAAYNFAFAAFDAMLVLFLEREIGLAASSIGLVVTFVGVGALVGAFMARRLAGWVGHGPAIWLPIALCTPFALLMPLVAQPGWLVWLAATGLTVVGFGVVAYNVAQVSFRQARTPDHLLGRMNATMRFLVWGTMPLGALLGGAMGEWLGVRTTLLASALVASAAFLPVFFSSVRTMRELPTILEPAEPAPSTH